MEFRENIDSLMSNVKVSEELHRAILEGKPQKEAYRIRNHALDTGSERAETGGRTMRNGRIDRTNRTAENRRNHLWRQAAVPVAAALLVMSTMYVGAGYLIDHTPLRDIFTTRDSSALPVPEAQQRPDIYGEILDGSFSSAGSQAVTGTGAGTEVGTETGTEAEGTAGETAATRGRYGEIVMDNEMFTIEMLEMTCAGQELTASYILTRKTEDYLTVHVSIDNDYLGQWRDGLVGEEYDISRTLMRSGFGNSFQWNKLPQGCGYELAENQELCIITQLGKTNYASGTYTLYAEAYLHRSALPAEGEGESFQQVEFFRTPIEIVRTGDYGLALSGALDKTEEQVHFDQYDIYVSPLTVYLTLEGTYQGEVSEIWGMQRSHDITIVFADGTQTKATVLLNGMGYGKGAIDVDMRASFGTAIDPDSIVKVMLDDIVLMGE